MMRNVVLLIKKDFWYRFPWVMPMFFLFAVFVLPLISEDMWNGNSSFIILGFIGSVFSFSGAYGDSASVFGLKYRRVSFLGGLPVTRMEIVLSRYVPLFTGLVFSAILLWFLSMAESYFTHGAGNFYTASPAVIVVSLALALLVSYALLLVATLFNSTAALYALSFCFYFALMLAHIVLSLVLRKFQPGLMEACYAVIGIIFITAGSIAINYGLVRRRDM